MVDFTHPLSKEHTVYTRSYLFQVLRGLFTCRDILGFFAKMGVKYFTIAVVMLFVASPGKLY